MSGRRVAGERFEPRLREVAGRLIWWKDPDAALTDRRRFLAQAMTFANWDEMELVREHFGDQALRGVLADPPAGVFDRRSWTYWHARLGISPVPALPRRPERGSGVSGSESGR